MAIVYLEDLVKHVPNKYLAVNVIAKRARSLNDELLGAGLSKKPKPVSVATDELQAGKLSYRILDPNAPEFETEADFTSESEGYEVLEGAEQIAEIFGERPAEDSETDAEDLETDIDDSDDDTDEV